MQLWTAEFDTHIAPLFGAEPLRRFQSTLRPWWTSYCSGSNASHLFWKPSHVCAIDVGVKHAAVCLKLRIREVVHIFHFLSCFSNTFFFCPNIISIQFVGDHLRTDSAPFTIERDIYSGTAISTRIIITIIYSSSILSIRRNSSMILQ